MPLIFTRHSHIRTNERMINAKEGGGKSEEDKRRKVMARRSWEIRGRVIKGEGTGRKLGYPTANLTRNYFHHHPADDGVYCGLALIGARVRPALAIIGVKRKIEIHVLHWRRNLYGQYLRMTIIKKIRPLRLFKDSQKMKARIKKDIAAACRILKIK